MDRAEVTPARDVLVAAALAAIVFFVCAFFAPRGFHLGFVDMGHDGYQMRQVLDLEAGGVIFKDTFDQYGPLTGYLNTLGFVALGRRLLAVKYFLAAWYAVIAVLLFVMARRWLSRPLAAFSVLVWLALAPFYQHGVMISAHVYVLCFQAVATLIALRATDLKPWPFASIGALAGLCAIAKSSMGAAFALAILLYLSLRVVVDRRLWKRAMIAACAFAGGSGAVLVAALVFLSANRALNDWYLQTVAFPRQFYLEYGQPSAFQNPGLVTGLLTRFASLTIANFFEVQSQQAFYWWVIRAVVVASMVIQLVRRRASHDLLLMGCIAAVLWLGVFASLNFMHQWWTVSLSIAPFVLCISAAVHRVTTDDRVRPLATAALVLVVIGPGLSDRKSAVTFRLNTLTETIDAPPIYRGIRTDAATKRAFEALHDAIVRYRTHHPATKLVTIDASDGWWTGINRSLPFLSAFEGNSHPQPAYWPLPVLTTAIYPQYGDAVLAQIRGEHPLVIEHHLGWYKPRGPDGYSVLAAAQNDDGGNWYLYAADHADRAEHNETSTYVATDGKIESGFAERGVPPRLAMRLSPAVDAAFRGRPDPASRAGDTIEVPGTFPVVLRDAALASAHEPIDVYTWPRDLREANLDGGFHPLPANPIARADIVRELAAGRWTVDGYAPAPYTYLLKFDEATIVAGAYFVVRGEVDEGGFTVGLQQNELWSMYVNVTQPGPFEVVAQVQKAGRYALTVANCLETGWWQTAWRYRLRQRFGWTTVGPNRFHVTQAGWVHPA